jgi:heat shock protein HslJ
MNKITLLIHPALLVGALILAACSGTNSLAGTSWTLVSYGDPSSPTAAASGVETSLVFGTDGQVSGSMGCNGFGGDYSVSGDTLTFGSIISTMMACDEPRMTQESTAFAVMNGKTTFTINGDTLTITSTDGAKVLLLTKK